MSYSSHCSSAGFTSSECPVIPYFSNPRIYYKGEVLGVLNTIDSVSKLNTSAAAVSLFKTATSSHTPDLSGCLEDTSTESGVGKCFIATATFDSPLNKHVINLRHFRDYFLIKYSWGKSFINWYYNTSPPYAKIISKNPMLKLISKILLYPIIYLITYPLIFLGLIIIFFISIIFLQKKRAYGRA